MEDKIYELGKYCVDHQITIEDINDLIKDLRVRQMKRLEDENHHIEHFLNVRDKVVSSGDIRIDFSKQMLQKGSQVIKIHKHELLILQLLISNPKETIPDEEIMKMLKTYQHKVSLRSMVVYLSRISHIVGQSPVEDEYVKRQWKRGYYWNYRTKIEE